jgi:hypothetical protein
MKSTPQAPNILAQRCATFQSGILERVHVSHRANRLNAESHIVKPLMVEGISNQPETPA